MAMIRPMAKLAAFLLVLGVAATASAQRHSPFIDFGYFEPDFQFFAPAEVGDFGGEEPPNTGVYFDYDRLYLNCTRPENEASLDSPYEGDFSWGNRYEIGYMTEEDNGWQAIVEHYIVDMTETLFQERLDRFNDDDDLAGGNPDPILQDRNPRHYDLRTSLNSARYSSLELNKVWRRKTFHHGGILEPLIGFRSMNFRDQYIRDNYVRFQETGPPVPGNPNPAIPDVNGTFEQLTTDQAFFDNRMIGGQLGARYFHQRGHWLLSAEVRMFGLVNFQVLENIQFTKLTRYSALGGDPELEINSITRAFTNNTQFVWGGEARGEAAYELTRDISLRVGFLFIDLGQGIGRGNTLQFNNQDVIMAGATFGLTVNR
jgi:hypothetical protein